MAQAAPKVALALPCTVPFHRLRMGGAVLPPIACVVATPFMGTLATNLAVFGVRDQLLLAVVAATTLLAGRLGAHRLFRMESGELERLVAITAAPLNHPNRVKASAAPYSWEK